MTSKDSAKHWQLKKTFTPTQSNAQKPSGESCNDGATWWLQSALEKCFVEMMRAMRRGSGQRTSKRSLEVKGRYTPDQMVIWLGCLAALEERHQEDPAKLHQLIEEHALQVIEMMSPDACGRVYAELWREIKERRGFGYSTVKP